MRTIKFRAWGGKTMLYSHNNTINQDYFQMSWFFNRLKDTAPLMQFTGVKDKKGVDIYDGDVVHYDGKPFCIYSLKATGVIVNRKGSWALKYKENYKTDDGREVFSYYNFSCEDFFHKKSEVIGNIHENLELI